MARTVGIGIAARGKILEIGCGMAFLARIHPGWHGAEYSKTAVARVKERDGQAAKIFEEDAQCLSFESGSFDGVFSWAALEHVPDPNKAFLEVDRILCVGGVRLDYAGMELPLMDGQEDRAAAGV